MNTVLLNKWWQERFDKKHPKEALRRKLRDGVLKTAKKSPSKPYPKTTS